MTLSKHSLVLLTGLLIIFLSNCSSEICALERLIDEAPENSAFLSWDANTENDLTGYKVHYGRSEGIYDQDVDVGLTDDPENPHFLVSDLEFSTHYYFVVTAYDASGNESGFSNEVDKLIE